MLSRNRFLLSLVVALCLSTLALADSAPVSIAFLHSSTGVSAASHTYSGNENENATWNSHAAVSPSGNGGFAQLHGTISRQNGNWGAWHVGTPGTPRPPAPLATPEPGSLMLLSTGLMGIAGAMRRKLHRA